VKVCNQYLPGRFLAWAISLYFFHLIWISLYMCICPAPGFQKSVDETSTELYYGVQTAYQANKKENPVKSWLNYVLALKMGYTYKLYQNSKSGKLNLKIWQFLDSTGFFAFMASQKHKVEISLYFFCRVFFNECYFSYPIQKYLGSTLWAKMGGKISLYIGHFDIQWSQSIQMIF
jgi:hypothetical protein